MKRRDLFKALGASMVVAIVAPLASPRRATFNVRDYGALGDGHTDDTRAIECAIRNAERVSGIVLFPSGSYRLDRLRFPRNVIVDLRPIHNTTITNCVFG